ncbi:hypothetical protein ACTD5D_16880 [Nocardia takedensis]|uniref:hypothetical protein n=1 Tax=Nocardia takedensis TaxID=259390 RepID=UPI00031AD8A0|nr:hypothetical protein [Nocardia takedensis]
MNGEPEGPGTNELFEHGMAFVAAGDLDRAAESAHELAERGGDDKASTVFRAVIERFERIGDLERIPVCWRCAKPLTRRPIPGRGSRCAAAATDSRRRSHSTIPACSIGAPPMKVRSQVPNTGESGCALAPPPPR